MNAAVLDVNEGLSPFAPAVLELLESMPEPAWLAHPDGRIAFASSKTFAMLDVTPEALYDNGWIGVLHPEERDHVVNQVRNTLETGAPFNIECRMRRGDGKYTWIRSRATALRQNGQIVAFLGHIIDIDRYVGAERIHHALMDTIPIMLWEANPSGEVTFFNKWFYDYTGLHVGETLSGDFWKAIHPDDVERYVPQWDEHRKSPVRSDNECRYRRALDGAYRWHLVHSEPITDEHGNVARWFGYCIDIHDQRRAAERQEFLLRATGALSPLLDPDTLFHRLVRECVPDMGDSALLFLWDGNELGLAAVVAEDAKRVELIRELYRVYQPGEDDPVRACVVRRESLLIDPAMLERARANRPPGRLKDLLESLHTKSTIVTPLTNESGPIGALVTSTSSSGRVYDASDLQTLQLLGERVGVIIENAQRFAREHRVAQAMQNASLPQSLPSPRGLKLDAFYAAAASDAQVGGDWYDAVELADGRVVLSIGDVTGRGLHAAVTMANIRQIIRGIAHVHPDPALMLEAADRALRAEHPETYVTAFACVVDPIEATLLYASAGHPPALLRKADGTVTTLGSPGLPLGLRRKTEPSSTAVAIARGDTLVLYTDGLTELDRKPVEGERAVVECLSRGDILHDQHPAVALFETLVGSNACDDVAILVAHVQSLSGTSTTLRRWQANARDEKAMRVVRSQVLEDVYFSAEDEEIVFRCEMVLGELIGNAVRHTPGTVEVVLERRRGATILHLLDDGDGFQFVPKLPLDAYSERGRGLYIAAQLADDFSVTRRPHGGSHARALIAH